MSKYSSRAEFFEQDLGARINIEHWRKRSRKLLRSEPKLLERGFQNEEGPQQDPSLVGLESDYDQIPLEDLVAIGHELQERADVVGESRYMDWDEVLPGNGPTWSA